MISEKARTARRRNGRQSRGPRTMEGKARSSSNATRHGLNTVHLGNQRFAPEIERLAKAICKGRAGDQERLLEQALLVAENDILLQLVREERVAVIERLRNRSTKPIRRPYSTLAEAKSRIEEGEMAYQEYSRLARSCAQELVLLAIDPNPSNMTWTPPEKHSPRPEHVALRMALPELKRLERYERRAWSRGNRAIGALFEIQQEGLAPTSNAGHPPRRAFPRQHLRS